MKTAAGRRQQMEVMTGRKRTSESPLTNIWSRNKLLIAAALVGLALAAWQLWRR